VGFAPDARVLIVNCDDFGMHFAVNAAVVESIENGIASSCSLMVPCPAAADAMRLLRERPHIPFGIHLALIRDSPEYRWGPAAAKVDVPSLLDPDTDELYVNTPAQRTALLAEAKLTDVERERCAQIDGSTLGLAPNAPRLALPRRRRPRRHPWLGDGARQGVRPRRTVWLDDGRRKARELGKPLVDSAFLDSYSISLHDKAATYARRLRDLPPGLNEWAIHSAHRTEQWQTIEPTGWQIRQSDHAFLTSPQAREILDHEGITVIDYRPLQQAWNA
jgi:predicted glycoside hydrolase/deacetylase ChbG (UPF0249 family)